MEENKFDSFCTKVSKKWNKFASEAYDFLCRKDNTVSVNKRANSAVIALTCVVLFFVMLYLNFCTPYLNDDYSYFNIFSENGIGTFNLSILNERVDSLSDIVTSMKAHYNVMNGRVLIHSIVQLVLMFPKGVFNVLNSAMYVALMLLIYKHCKGFKGEDRAVLFILICLAVWTFIPDYGKTVLWLTGSVNYLWSSVIRLAILLPIRLYADGKDDKHTVAKTILMTVLCLLAGATSENTGAAFIGVTVLFMIYCRVHQRKIPVWYVTGLVGAMCGFFFMVFAPGNSRRRDIAGEIANSVLSRLTNIPGNTILYLSVFVGAFAVCAIILYAYDRKNGSVKTGIALIYLIGAFGAAGVMVASPYFPTRAWFGIFVYAITAVGILIYRILLNENLSRRLILIAAVFWAVWGTMSTVHTMQDMTSLRASTVKREAYIAEQKKQGNLDIEIEKYVTSDKHSPTMESFDIEKEDENWRNITFAMHNGLNSVRAKTK